jgi:hypothetical protein
VSAADPRPASFLVRGTIDRIDPFFYTYEPGDGSAPVIAGVRLSSSEITLYTRQQAQEIADAFLGLVAQFAEHESRAAGEDGAR